MQTCRELGADPFLQKCCTSIGVGPTRPPGMGRAAQRAYPALPGITRNVPKVLEPCRRIKRSAMPTRASVTLCCDQFRGHYVIDWAAPESFGPALESIGPASKSSGRAVRRNGGPISDAYVHKPNLAWA